MTTPLHLLYKNEYVSFIRFLCKDINEQAATDMFMNMTKKLQAMLVKPSSNNENQNPNTSNANSRKNQDLDGMGSPPNMKQQQLGPYGLSTNEINSIRLDLQIVDAIYDKWASEDDSLSGVLNTKLTKQKNADFRLKLDSWKNRTTERKNLKKKWFEHGKALRKCFEESKSLFNMDKQLLLDCIDKYNVFCDDNR